MTNEELKLLEDKLWDAANRLRASGGIKASDYAVPVLGIIFLRFADNRYREHEEEIENLYKQSQNTRARRKKKILPLPNAAFTCPLSPDMITCCSLRIRRVWRRHCAKRSRV